MFFRFVAVAPVTFTISTHFPILNNMYKALSQFSRNFSLEIKTKMRDVLAKMRECEEEGKMLDFPYDCGTVDTYHHVYNHQSMTPLKVVVA